jgi:spore coat protein U-like protein
MKKELNKTKSFFANKSKMSVAKSTTALTCLIGSLIITSNSGAVTSTTTGQMVASSSVAASCTISAGAMTFAAFTNTTISATSVITANCTNGTSYTISFNDAATGGLYYLTNTTTGLTDANNRLEASFTNGTTAMTAGAATITSTGTGSSATPGTITGTIASGQTGKTSGTYSKSMTLNLVY